MECDGILKTAEAEEAKGNYEEAAKLYYRTSICFGMADDLPRYEATKRKSGEIFMGICRRSERPVLATKAGLSAYKVFGELRDPRADECVRIVLDLISNNGNALLADKETCISTARFLREHGKMAESIELYTSLADDLEGKGNHLLAARLYTDAANGEEGMKGFKRAAGHNKHAGELFVSCGLYLEASQHFVRSFLESIIAGGMDVSVLKLSDEACYEGNIRENWHTKLVTVCRILSEGNVRGARGKWASIRFKFKPSFGSLVDQAIDEMGKRSGNTKS
jgi:hypothetical protein